MTDNVITALVRYGEERGLITKTDSRFVLNRLLEIMRLDGIDPAAQPEGAPLCELLAALGDDAVGRGLIGESTTERDLFDTKLMTVQAAAKPAPSGSTRIFLPSFIQTPA